MVVRENDWATMFAYILREGQYIEMVDCEVFEGAEFSCTSDLTSLTDTVLLLVQETGESDVVDLSQITRRHL